MQFFRLWHEEAVKRGFACLFVAWDEEAVGCVGYKKERNGEVREKK
jgi:hypothetical protein